jgi:hypothetical protein
MKISRSLLGAALAAALSATTLVAQQPQTGYHTVACLKVKPDRGADFHKFAAEESHKLAQGRVDDGEVTTWNLLRAVLPQGSSAECDYISIYFFPGTPHLLGTQELSAALKKAGMSITPEDYVNHRNAVATVVSVAVFQTVASVGSAKKGDYFLVNYMKAGDVEAWVDYERKIWQPLAEAAQKDGTASGWSVNVRVLPGGDGQPFQGVTVDVFPSMDAVFMGNSKLIELFRKVHPDMEVGTTMEQFGKLRTQQDVQLYQLEDAVTK